MIQHAGKYFKTETTDLWIREKGILQTRSKPNSVMTIEEAQELTAAHTLINKGIPMLLLCDISNVIRMPKECRDYFSGSKHGETFIACALITKSKLSALIGSFFLGLNKPLKPTRLFNDEEKAIKWLKSF